MTKRASFLLPAVWGVLVAPLPCQYLWANPAVTAGPAARRDHAMAFDSAHGCVVMFGGIDASGNRLADTWIWNGSAWQQLFPQHSPTGRSEHAMAFDSTRSRVVLVGGLDGVSIASAAQTWEWDGVDWSLMTPAYGGLLGKAMVFDVGAARLLSCSGSLWWEFDGAGWLGASGHPVWGLPGNISTLACDTARSVVVSWCTPASMSVGGFDLSLWERAAGVWIQRTWPSPPYLDVPSGRSEHRLAFDASAGRTILFGGVQASGACPSDTWAWNGVAWHHLSSPQSPEGRSRHAMVFDPLRGDMVLFGGAGWSCVPLGDTWLGRATLASAQTYGVGCGQPYLGLAPAPGSRPILGATQQCNVVGAYLGIALMACGTSATSWNGASLPFPLDLFGVQGCSLAQSADLALDVPCTPTGWTTARLDLAIPSTPTVLGMTLHLQAWTLQPGFNDLGVVLSNGLTLVLGDL